MTEVSLSVFQACLRERMRLLIRLHAVRRRLDSMERGLEYPPSQAETMLDREQELRYKINEIIASHQQAAQDEIAPLVKTLSLIEGCRPPKPIALQDGRVMQYVGPLPTWAPGDKFTFDSKKPPPL